MSKSAGPKGEQIQDREAFALLEKAVDKLLDERKALLGKVAELEAALEGAMKSGLDPVALQERLEQAEAQNSELRSRIEEGREGIDRLLSRLRFLEDQR